MDVYYISALLVYYAFMVMFWGMFIWMAIYTVLEILIRVRPSRTIMVDGEPYLTRHYIVGDDKSDSKFAVFIHHFHKSDQPNELHNHPWSWGLSLIMFGGYYEDSLDWSTNDPDRDFRRRYAPEKRRRIRFGMLNFFNGDHFHRVDLVDPIRGAWTLFVAGKRLSSWGFLDRKTREFRDWRTNPDAIE